jgi:hypothetical protein
MNGSGAGLSKKIMLLADLYKFDQFRKNSSRNVLLAIDYLPFYIMFFNMSVLFKLFNVTQSSSVTWLFQFALNPGSYLESILQNIL